MTHRLLDQDRVREIHRQHRLLRSIERRMSPLFRVEIMRVSKLMTAGFRKTSVVPGLLDDHKTKIANIFMQTIMITTKIFAKRILDQTKASSQIFETKEAFNEIFDRLALEHVRNEAVRTRIVNISTKTRTDIVSIVAKGQTEGLGIDAIARLVTKEVGDISRLRAAVIARTETHSAANAANDGAALATGLDLQKEWMTSIDGRERDAHRAADEQVVEMNKPFIVGGESLMFPGDPAGSPENTINCRCVVGHIVKE